MATKRKTIICTDCGIEKTIRADALGRRCRQCCIKVQRNWRPLKARDLAGERFVLEGKGKL